MDLPAFSAYNDSRPQAFYLGADEEFASLADAAIFAQDDSKLACHSHVLSVHSRVLKALFAAVRDSNDGAAAVSSGQACWAWCMQPGPSSLSDLAKRITWQAEDDVWLQSSFAGYSVHSVAAFLRFCYQPEDACAENFKQLGDELCSVGRLCHQLDCPRLLSKLDTYLSDTGQSGLLDDRCCIVALSNLYSCSAIQLLGDLNCPVVSATVHDAVSWAVLAEDCSLSKLRVHALRQAARALVTTKQMSQAGQFGYDGYSYSLQAASERVSQAVTGTSALKELSHDSLLVVMSAFVAAGRRVNISSHLPTADELLAHLD